MKKKGFTLIELMVVLSIINSLSSIIFNAISDARKRASDAAVQQSLGQMKLQAEIFKSKYGSYNYSYENSGFLDDERFECIFNFIDFNDPEFLGNGQQNPEATHNESIFGRNGLYDLSVNVLGFRNVEPGYRIYCAIGGDPYDSWAFAVPVNRFNSEGKQLGWCVDSSGVAQYIVNDFSAQGAPLGGTKIGQFNTVAKCP